MHASPTISPVCTSLELCSFQSALQSFGCTRVRCCTPTVWNWEEGPGLEPMFTLQCRKIMNIRPGTPHHPFINSKGYHAMDIIITLHCAVRVPSKKSQTGLDCSLAFSRALDFFSLGWLGWGPSGSPKPASLSATLAARAAALSRARCAASDSGMCQKPAFYHRSIPDGYIAVTGQ